jgi:His-Xaa-Ser system radical SAM maturase HxsB
VNEVGDYLIGPIGTSRLIVDRKLQPSNPLYADLVSSFFISPTPVPDLIDVLATRYRTKKSFLDSFTRLHIFVMTLRCNQTCHYCQVSRQSEDRIEYDISFKDLDRSIQLMFFSPSRDLTVEFQGGEPLLAFDKVKYGVERINEINKTQNKNITFVLCTNLLNMSQDVLDFCAEHRILISTSLDGPEYVHNSNRLSAGYNTYEQVTSNIKKCRELLGYDRVSALMTTPSFSLRYPIEIIDEYRRQGFTSIFLRAINPYGLARTNPETNMYYTNKFIEFYKIALLYIIELNLKGIFFVEQYARIILSKILTPFCVGFTDLQSPAGVINNVVVYNHDGFVYVSDEGRMLAAEGDFTFRLGHVQQDSYQDIFYGKVAHHISECWTNESLPGCSECAFQPYCGADPVRNYATQGDMVGYRPTSCFCRKNMEIIRFLFELISQNQEIEQIFRSWVNNKPL